MADDVTLREYVDRELENIRDIIVKFQSTTDQRFLDSEKAVQTAFDAAKEAVIKSETGVEKRSDAVYVTISKLQEAFAAVMPRSETEQRFTSLNEKIDLNNKTLVEKVDSLATRFERNEGQGAGLKMGYGWIIAAIGALAAIVSILAR